MKRKRSHSIGLYDKRLPRDVPANAIGGPVKHIDHETYEAEKVVEKLKRLIKQGYSRLHVVVYREEAE